MRTFPAVVTGIFAALAIGAVLIFATFSGGSGSSAVGSVAIWGSLPHDVVNAALADVAAGNQDYGGVIYTVIPSDQLVPQLVEAIASGRGPDLVLLPEKNLVGQASKLQTIPYASMSSRSFQDSFIQAGTNFLSSTGIFGLPFTVDPLVMYWNRGLFSDAGLATPPRYWDELTDIAPRLTKADKNGTLAQSAVALGTWSNVDHGKEILLTLLGQLGNSVVVAGTDKFQSVLSARTASGASADSALRFFTDFADPAKPSYSWNRSMPDSRDAFIAGKLAVYFGYASELSGIRAANPNLNFDVAALPAIRGGGQGGYASVVGLVIPRGSRNSTGALAVAQAFTGQSAQAAVAQALALPSVRTDVDTGSGADPYASVFRSAALKSFTFLDPDPSATDSIFQRMIENVTSGKLQVSEATNGADQELRALLGTR